jgi:SsrA-binding protein
MNEYSNIIIRSTSSRYNACVAKAEKTAGTPTISNRKAFHDYSIEEELEAGVVLLGCEVKMIRRGSFELRDAYCELREGELWLVGSTIPEYAQASSHIPYDPVRRRKLLLHAAELKRLERKVREKGFTLIPLRAYFKQGKVKLAVALARGKKQYDKRESIKARDVERDELRSRS